jgi:hypothetical protein
VRVIPDDALEDPPAPGTVAEQLAEVMRTTPADSGFGDLLAETVRDLRSWMDNSEREWR